ncbi:MAG: type II secretion system minor pseudopilin GspI, partial [Halioglobus sp.]|nr:type II secretion system minor pseudopilin GspI [Halioglobus sp.]
MRARGFTLVEVMVALAVVAVALPALLISLYQQADDTGYLRDKAIAHGVAVNKLAEMRLTVAASRSLQPGRTSGQTRMAERDWFWWIDTQPAPGGIDQFYRTEIRVALEQARRDQPLYSLVAYMSGDLQTEADVVTNNDDNGDGDSGDGGTGGRSGDEG